MRFRVEISCPPPTTSARSHRRNRLRYHLCLLIGPVFSPLPFGRNVAVRSRGKNPSHTARQGSFRRLFGRHACDYYRPLAVTNRLLPSHDDDDNNNKNNTREVGANGRGWSWSQSQTQWYRRRPKQYYYYYRVCIGNNTFEIYYTIVFAASCSVDEGFDAATRPRPRTVQRGRGSFSARGEHRRTIINDNILIFNYIRYTAVRRPCVCLDHWAPALLLRILIIVIVTIGSNGTPDRRLTSADRMDHRRHL